MLPYIAEFLGTMILIILGDGVVANVNLNKSGMKGGGRVQQLYIFCSKDSLTQQKIRQQNLGYSVPHHPFRILA